MKMQLDMHAEPPTPTPDDFQATPADAAETVIDTCKTTAAAVES